MSSHRTKRKSVSTRQLGPNDETCQAATSDPLCSVGAVAFVDQVPSNRRSSRLKRRCDASGGVASYPPNEILVVSRQSDPPFDPLDGMSCSFALSRPPPRIVTVLCSSPFSALRQGAVQCGISATAGGKRGSDLQPPGYTRHRVFGRSFSWWSAAPMLQPVFLRLCSMYEVR